MKSILFALIGLSLSYETAMAASAPARSSVLAWVETAQAKQLMLRQDIELADGTVIRAGETFLFQEESNLSAVPVVFQEVVAAHCTTPDLQVEEMALVTPLATSESVSPARDTSVGVTLRPGCRLGIYIELADYHSPSLFTRPE